VSIRLRTAQSQAPGFGAAQRRCAVDSAHREQLILECLAHVRYVARRIHERLPPQVSLDDLVQCGVLGLMDALQKYDPSKNVQLKHYAAFRIRGAILDSLRQVDWSPRALRRKARKIEQAVANCKARLGRDPSESELAMAVGMTLKTLQRIKGDLRALEIGSLQSDSGEACGEQALRAGPSFREDPYHQTLRSELSGQLAEAVGELPDRERELLTLYYFEERTMKEVGVLLGIGESRVSQIHSALLLRLRTRLCGCAGDPSDPRTGARPQTSPAAAKVELSLAAHDSEKPRIYPRVPACVEG
jgi:RNA polymerase sigma factor FliA